MTLESESGMTPINDAFEVVWSGNMYRSGQCPGLQPMKPGAPPQSRCLGLGSGEEN